MGAGYDPLASVQAAGPPGTISFVYGLPDPATFPASDLRSAAEQVLHERPAVALQYGPEQGYGPLLDYLRHRLWRQEGLTLGRSQIMLTGGSAAALDLVCTILARPGDRVLVEAPTYHESLQLFRDHGLLPVQIPTDDDGLLVTPLALSLEAQARRDEKARFLYTIPNFQNPSGVTLASERRRNVLELARKHSLLVIEDDVYRDLCYEGEVPPSLFALDGGRQVLRIGTFSKILAPGLRMGWLMGPPGLVKRLVGSGLLCMGGGANPLVANILATYCQRGLLEDHVRELCLAYRGRRDLAMAALAEHMPSDVRWTKPEGGFFTWMTLPASQRAARVVRRAKQAGVWVLPGDPFFAEQPTGQYLRLAFSYLGSESIEQGIRILGSVIGNPHNRR